FDGVSRRFGDFPISLNVLGSFNAGADGSVMAAAASASAPYFNRALVSVLITAPFSARHEVGSTFHCFAAAWISISRAVAPAWRSVVHELRTLALPKTPWLAP